MFTGAAFYHWGCFLMPNNNLKNHANILGLLITTTFILCNTSHCLLKSTGSAVLPYQQYPCCHQKQRRGYQNKSVRQKTQPYSAAGYEYAGDNTESAVFSSSVSHSTSHRLPFLLRTFCCGSRRRRLRAYPPASLYIHSIPKRGLCYCFCKEQTGSHKNGTAQPEPHNAAILWIYPVTAQDVSPYFITGLVPT